MIRDATSSTTRPAPPFLLGWAGVIPFAALAVASVAGWRWPIPAGAALLAYGAAILSFMGGAQWGLTMRAPGGIDRRPRGYAISVVPALLGWVALLVGPGPGLPLLAVAFAALLAYDLWTVRRGEAPAWYRPLRVQLTTAVILCLLVARFAGTAPLA